MGSSLLASRLGQFNKNLNREAVEGAVTFRLAGGGAARAGTLECIVSPCEGLNQQGRDFFSPAFPHQPDCNPEGNLQLDGTASATGCSSRRWGETSHFP